MINPKTLQVMKKSKFSPHDLTFDNIYNFEITQKYFLMNDLFFFLINTNKNDDLNNK